MSHGITRRNLSLGTVSAGALGAMAWAPSAWTQTGKQTPFTIVINSSPWFDGFRKVVEAYEAE